LNDPSRHVALKGIVAGKDSNTFLFGIQLDLEGRGSHFDAQRLNFITSSNHTAQEILPDYLVWYISHKQAQRYFSQHVAGTALPHVNRTVLENLPVIRRLWMCKNISSKPTVAGLRKKPFWNS